jgi:hypothetical protein
MKRIVHSWLMFAVIFATLAANAAPVRAQRPDGLDTPLRAANLCGPGDGSEIHFTLAATGDTFPHENIQAVGEAQGYDVLFDAVRPFLQSADLAYTNFDGAMLEGAGYTGYPNFNFNPALATALKAAGIGVVSTANNHILDRGPEGLDATLRVLEANGIVQHGAVPSNAEARPAYLPITIERDGVSITIGFIAATWGTNGIPDPYNQVTLLYQSTEYGRQGGVRQEILDAVALAAAETDVVIVAAHWGYEYQFYPDASQVEAARLLAEAGADVILGAQSHTLQPVDILDVNGRKALVVYSLANFLASQGAFQAAYYSATATIFYVGLARAADGSVRVTGYRYLPTIHVENDTRPAPIPAGAEPGVISHVRTIMRDPAGTRQVSPAPPTGRVEVCPPIALAETPDVLIPGDFAQHYTTLGGDTARPITDGIAVLGLPLGGVRQEPAGDCATPTTVLYTERQRLELNPNNAWPYRVTGTQLGPLSLRERHPDVEPAPQTDLTAAEAFADPAFRTFYEQNGGLALFGYPISPALSEPAPDGGALTVQYFERARFERTADGQVQLGLLGREFPDLAAICGPAFARSDAGEGATETASVPALPGVSAGAQAGLNLIGRGIGFWLPVLAALGLLVALLALVAFAVADWRAFNSNRRPRSYRPRRTAHERFAPSVELQRRSARQDAPASFGSSTPSAQGTTTRRTLPADEEDDLLRQLLNQ